MNRVRLVEADPPVIMLFTSNGAPSFSGPIVDKCAGLVGMSRVPGESDASLIWRIEDARKSLYA